MFVPVGILLALAAVNAASVPFNGRIVGGSAVLIESFPYQAAMLHYGEHLCGASIIGPRIILTAAHCTDGINPAALSVRIGSTYHLSGGEIIRVSSVIQHEEYDYTNYNNDISILILDRDMVYGESVQPVGIATSEPPTGTWCDVTGWGRLKENGEKPINLQLVQLPIISRDSCEEMYSGYDITENMICAGFARGERDACQGDSGGPLVVNGAQVGVVSWGVGCARPNKPGIFTNVAKFRSWISDKTGLMLF